MSGLHMWVAYYRQPEIGKQIRAHGRHLAAIRLLLSCPAKSRHCGLSMGQEASRCRPTHAPGWLPNCQSDVLLNFEHVPVHAGNVLLPIDAAGRVLELLLLLDRHWEKAKLYFTLVFLAPQARQVLESAKTQLMWMSDAVLQAFERSRDNPFALRYTLQLTPQCRLLPLCISSVQSR